MASRTDILARLPGVAPIAVTEAEAAALCGMSQPTFKRICPLNPAERGKGRYYPYDDVRAWFRSWWLAESGLGVEDDAKSDEELLGRLDGQDAA